MSDLRIAARSLLRHRGFTAVSVTMLALGIAANTVIFSIYNGVLVRPLPYREPDRLAAVQEIELKFTHAFPVLPVNASHYLEWKQHNTSFENLALLGGATFTIDAGGDAQRVSGALVSPSLFPITGAGARLGRTFLESEDVPGRDRVVLLSDHLWERMFHRDPNVLGRKILLDGTPHDIVGILPEYPVPPYDAQVISMLGAGSPPEIWKPIALRPEELPRMGDFNYGSVGRLKPGVTLAQASADLNAILAQIARALPRKPDLRVSLAPLQEQITARSRQGLVFLLGAVLAVLAIIAVNIASLMLIRTAARQRELAIRLALGSGFAGLIRQVLTEAALLAGTGGLLGILAAYVLLGVVLVHAPAGLSRVEDIHIDSHVLAFSFLLTFLSGTVFALVPALRINRSAANEALKSGGRGATEPRERSRTRALLIATEVALSTVTLAAAGLLLNSFVRLLHVDRGFVADRVLTAELDLPAVRYPDDTRRAEFLRSAIENVAAIPGVRAVGVSHRLPLSGEGSNNTIVLEAAETAPGPRPIVDFRFSSPGYFRAMGVPVIAGRLFTSLDGARGVVVISEQTAQRLWPGANPIGKRFHLGSETEPLLEVIGVVGDLRGVSLAKAPNLTVYRPYWQKNRASMFLALRTAGDPESVAGAVRAGLRKLDRQLAIPQMRTMAQIVGASVAERRFQLDLAALFGVTALLLAALGVYGAVSYSVAQRTNEMGVRIVLGARPSSVRRLVLRRGLAPVFTGLAVGLLATSALGRVLAGLLFEIRPADPVTLLAVAAVLVLSSVLACLLPAVRATRVDPAVALRYD